MLALESEGAVGVPGLDVGLRVGEGECLALVGPSGAGKTTVLRVAAGLARPDRGRVACADELWLDTEIGIDLAPDRRRVGYVFQHYALFANLDVWRNVAFGMRGGSRADRRERAVALLERFGMSERAGARVQVLSGGERQRVALARALARQPRALLLDEPLSALDPRTRAGATRELGALLREAGVPTLLVTHDFGEAALLADRVAVMDRGRLIQVDTADRLSARPVSAFVADLAGAVVLEGRAGRRPDGLTEVALDGGGTVVSVQPGAGRVAVSMHSWDVGVAPASAAPAGSAQNRLPVTVSSVVAVGNRVRVELLAPQPFTAELTRTAAGGLGLEPGAQVVATFKATAARIVSL